MEDQGSTVERSRSPQSGSPREVLQDEVRGRLESGEKLIWSGGPQRGLLLRGSDIFAIPFTLAWCGFAVFWEYLAFTTGGPGFFLLWGGMFVAIGLYMVFGRFVTDALQRAKTYYAVTNRRVLIVSGLLRTDTRSLFLNNLSEINLSERSSGRGTITFGPQSIYSSMRGWPGASRNVPPAFEAIEEAQRVMSIIRDAQRSAAAQG